MGNINCLVLTTVLQEDGIFPHLGWKPEAQREWGTLPLVTCPGSMGAGPQTQVLDWYPWSCCYTKHCLVKTQQLITLQLKSTHCLLPHQKKGRTCKTAHLPNAQFPESPNLPMVILSFTSHIQFWLLRLKYVLNIGKIKAVVLFEKLQKEPWKWKGLAKTALTANITFQWKYPDFLSDISFGCSERDFYFLTLGKHSWRILSPIPQQPCLSFFSLTSKLKMLFN